jgi:hypothetical protein
VPWLASYANEKSPAGYSVLQYSTTSTWVEFRNDGGRAWQNSDFYNGTGRIWLYAVNSSGTGTRNSTFSASDWPQDYAPGAANTDDIGPGETGRVTFNLYAAASGSFSERFNLGAHEIANGSVYFFNYGYVGNYYIPINVAHCC